MENVTQLVTVFGGAGFVGTQVVQALAQKGYRIRVAVRRPDLAGHVRMFGGVGQVVPIQANVRDPDSVMRAVAGAAIVVNLVGIGAQRGKQNFQSVHVAGARNIASAAKAAGATTLIHMSVLGADSQSPSAVARSRAAGEAEVLAAYDQYEFHVVYQKLSQFIAVELSSVYHDVIKDRLYTDAANSPRRRSTQTALHRLVTGLCQMLAPILVFTAEEAWLERYPQVKAEDGSVHLELFVEAPTSWLDPELAERWAKIRRVRRVVTGALELERAAKRIGSSLEAAPQVFVSDPDLLAALSGIDLAEVSITSGIRIESGEGPDDAFRLIDVPGVAVVPHRADGIKCARSWKYFDPKTADPAYPQVTPRDAKALRELGVHA